MNFKLVFAKRSLRLLASSKLVLIMAICCSFSDAYGQSVDEFYAIPPVQPGPAALGVVNTPDNVISPVKDDKAPRFLEVRINGLDKKLIGEFYENTEGVLFAKPDELEDVGIVAATSHSGDDGLIDLTKLKNVTYVYDGPNQAIDFNTSDMSALVPTQVDLMPDRRIKAKERYDKKNSIDEDVPTPSSEFGGLVNYTLYADSGSSNFSDLWAFQGLSAQLDGRVFGRYGTLSSNQVLRFASGDYSDTVRLDSAWSYWDMDHLTSYTVGDYVTRSLPWTRSVRMGGVQIRRNFSIRSDLVTMPLPSVSGSAVVPSSVDVYVNNAKRSTADLPAGPYRISDFPVVTGANDARLVVRDALGRESVTEVPFYASIDMLAEGLIDFSAEGGFMRYYYGSESANYGKDFAASATLRYGMSNALTLEGHSEYAADFYNGGIGAVFSLGPIGVMSISGAGSRFNEEVGQQVSVGLELEKWDLRFNARTQRTFGDYNDLASATARNERYHNDEQALNGDDFYFSDNYYSGSDKPVKTMNQLSVGVPLKIDPTTLNFSFTQTEYADAQKAKLLSFSASRSFGERTQAYITGYKDMEDRGRFGVFAGLSISLGSRIQMSTGISSDDNGTSYQTELRKSETREIGSTGWRLRDVEGSRSQRSAYGSYRSRLARVEGSVEQNDNDYRLTANVEGAIVAAGGGVFASNQIDDSFAIVDVGAPNIEVKKENRPYGKTGWDGKIIVPDLNSFQSTKLSINADNMPLDSMVTSTQMRVLPGYRSAVIAQFAIEQAGESALISLQKADGAFVTVGASIKQNSTELAQVGYDGQTLLPLKGLRLPSRFIVSELSGETCLLEVPEHIRTGVENGVTTLPCIVQNGEKK
ncbi:fimbria/pilus outer membrane usher protein [Bartonella sp. LJL80]